MEPRSSLFNYQALYSSHYVQAYAQQLHPPQSKSYSSTWYPPGSIRCTYKGCQFFASSEALEIHMMDRHLIYPPGWENRPKKQQWDADPSLRGKPIPIQGTNLILSTPEKLEAWILERKKRWPTAARVEEKKRKLEEAIASGQISGPLPSRSYKRRKTSPHDSIESRSPRPRTAPEAKTLKRPPHHAQRAVQASECRSSDEDNSPDVVSSKPALSNLPIDDVQEADTEKNDLKTRRVFFKRPLPRKEMSNPFASRSSLLRNLLLPEIRMTVSNLSQAIRFLIENDFLDEVEAIPGAAEVRLVQIVKDSQRGMSDTSASISNTAAN